MCLVGFIKFKRIRKENAVIGYRDWILTSNNRLKSINQDYLWPYENNGKALVTEKDSGFYSYNYYNHNHYDYLNNNYDYYDYDHYHYYNNNYNNYNNHNYYHIGGIIKQYGKIAIHSVGYRSEKATIITLFTIRKSDATGTEDFLNWIDNFNIKIEEVAKLYNANTIHCQDFVEQNKEK